MKMSDQKKALIFCFVSFILGIIFWDFYEILFM